MLRRRLEVSYDHAQHTHRTLSKGFGTVYVTTFDGCLLRLLSNTKWLAGFALLLHIQLVLQLQTMNENIYI